MNNLKKDRIMKKHFLNTEKNGLMNNDKIIIQSGSKFIILDRRAFEDSVDRMKLERIERDTAKFRNSK